MRDDLIDPQEMTEVPGTIVAREMIEDEETTATIVVVSVDIMEEKETVIVESTTITGAETAEHEADHAAQCGIATETVSETENLWIESGKESANGIYTVGNEGCLVFQFDRL